MPNQDAAFAGSIPAIYDRCLGPMLFEPFANDLAERAAALGATAILETAAGTGVATAALALALPDATIVATDLNPAMLDVAAARVDRAGVRFQPADAQSLPFADAAFDLVACQFGVMFMPDRVGAYREAWRVLRPGGAFLFNAWAGLDANPVAALTEQAMATMFPGDPPGFLGRTPYGYADRGRIAEDLAAAGFVDIECDPVTVPCRAPRARDAASGFCTGSPLRSEIEARDPARLDAAVDCATAAIEAAFGPAPLDATMAANVVTAIKPG